LNPRASPRACAHATLLAHLSSGYEEAAQSLEED